MAGVIAGVYLPKDHLTRLRRRAAARKCSVSSLIAAAVRESLFPDEPVEEPVGRQLRRIERRVEKSLRDHLFMKEVLLLFIRVWLEHTPPVDVEFEESAAESAALRFERFLDYVVRAVDTGRSVAVVEPPPLEADR